MKKLLALLLATVILFALACPVFAADDETTAAADALYALGLFKGTGTNADGTPNYDLDRTMNRAEAVTMLVRLLGKEEEAKAGTWNIPFTDVPDWAIPYVGYAYANGLTKGTGETTFGGSDLISATQYLTFVLRALGYDSSTDFQWDKAWELTDKLGITSGQYNAFSDFKRGNVVTISEKSLSAKKKNSDVSLLDTLVAAGAVSAQAAEDFKKAGATRVVSVVEINHLYAEINGEIYDLDSVIFSYYVATMEDGTELFFTPKGSNLIMCFLDGDYEIRNSSNSFLSGEIVAKTPDRSKDEEIEIDGHVVTLIDYGAFKEGQLPIQTSISNSDYLQVYKSGNKVFSIYHSEFWNAKSSRSANGNWDVKLLDKQGVKATEIGGFRCICVEDLANYLGIEISDYSISQLETGEYVISLK